MTKKQYRISLFILLGAVVLIALFSILVYLRYSFSNESDQNTPLNVQTQNEEFMFLIKEYDEKIGIYHTGESLPFQILEVYVQTLPSVDQMDLEKGIWIQNEEMLRKIIEDYES